MMAFDHVFLDVANREYAAIELAEHDGRPRATLVFREFYCNEPRCDCRRVVMMVEQVKPRRRVAASINYAFEKPRRRDEPQMFLDPINPQSELADELLDVFRVMVRDAGYRAKLVRHYEMWKAAVDDPAHPDHGKLRSRAHDDPAFRPAFARHESRQAKRRQARERSAPAQGIGLVVAARAAKADRKVQQRFTRLAKKVEQLRAQVGAWRDGRAGIDREIAVYRAAFDEQGRLARDGVTALDRAYGDPKLTKAERRKLKGLICTITRDLIGAGGHDDLKPLYSRYARSDYDAEAAAEESAGVQALKGMMEAMGVDLDDETIDSLDDLRAFAESEMRAAEEAEAAAAERRARRKKTPKQLEREAQRAGEERDAGKALQDVYRKLAVALHPDLERDDDERARKTELMQQVNIAYESKDLLGLLELELRFERVDAARADDLAEERLRHYIKILDDQARQLAVELEELELPWRIQLDRPPPARLTPAQIIAEVRADTDDVRGCIAQQRRDLEVFADVARLKVWLDALVKPPREGRAGTRDLFA